MASSTDSVDVECPVCHEDFTEAKFLPCGHVTCRKCILSWLSARGQGGCPLCRAPILPSPQPDQEKVIAGMVDKFPTDLVTMALVESKQALSGTHECGVCDVTTAAGSYCLECSIKLCSSCAKVHGKLPCSRDHRLEELDTLTPGRLAASRRWPCVSHPNRPGDMYCPAHLSLICLECFSASHHSCGVKPVASTAKQERAALSKQARRFREKESAKDEQIKKLTKEICTAQAHYQAQGSEIKAKFKLLQQRVEKRCHEILAQLQREEDDVVNSKRAEIASLEEQKAALAAHAGSVERLVVPAPDGALLGMLGQLKARLDVLEKKSEVHKVNADVTLVSVSWDPGMMTRLEQAIAALGHVTHKTTQAVAAQEYLVCGHKPEPVRAKPEPVRAKPTGAELAKILKVGDRVKRGQDWEGGNEDGGGLGKVTLVWAGDNAGWVDVKWDAGGENSYRMGDEDCYELELG